MMNGAPVVLRGVNIPDPSYNDLKDWEPDGVGTKFHVDNVVSKIGGSVIRLPILPGKKGGKEGWLGLGADKYFNDHLLPAVEYINSKGMFAIVDWHYISDWASLADETIEFWEYVAPRLGKNPKVIFEIFNEPINGRDWIGLRNKIMQPCIDIIRKHSDNLIIIGSPGWSSNLELLNKDNLCTGKNLTQCFHGYSNQWPDKAKNRIEKICDFAPIFATELGYEVGGTEGGTRDSYGAPYLNYLESKGISWVAWCHSKMWGPRLIDPNSNWELSDSGKLIRDYIQKAGK
jgi:endoglucanase